MPSTLLVSNIIQTDKDENHNEQHVPSTICKADQLPWINFLSSAIESGRQRKHGEKGCHQCDKVASYYIQVLVESQLHEMNEWVLELVWQMTKMLLEHMETRIYHSLSWFDMMAQQLWMYAKKIKEKDDYAINNNGELENAIRITIYHCRATIYQHDGGRDDLIKARLYYQKCLSLPTQFETQQSLQQTASTFISEHPSLVLHTNTSSIHSISSYDLSYFNFPPPLQSPSSIISTPSSISSSSSSSYPLNTSCGQCGLQKKAMPVCAKCKSQSYCTIKCLKNHQPTHTLVCQK